MSGFAGGNKKKRGNESGSGRAAKAQPGAALSEVEEPDSELVFEDPFGDEFDEEEEEEETQGGEDDEEGADEDAGGMHLQQEQENVGPKQIWRPGVDQVAEGEELEYDPSAYITYHSLRTEWPCLSFDVLRDNLGDNRERFPLTMFMVTGSQADRADRNKITLLKMSDIHKTQVSADSDGDESDDDNLDEDPTIEHVNVNHNGGVNRIRAMPQSPGVIASQSDNKQSYIYDLTKPFNSMLVKGPRATPNNKPVHSFLGHSQEGYALDWSHVTAGRLATGDCAGAVHIWNPTGSSAAPTWAVDPAPYLGHKGSVEDLQWSPSEATVFASCSTDKTLKIWDTRGRTGPQLSIDAHLDDVNVISWNRSVGYLLASGCDDGSFKVWDLRTVGRAALPLAHFTYHKGAITSLEWAPHDESVLTVASADNQVTVWDLSVEADDDVATSAAKAADAGAGASLGHEEGDDFFDNFPPQLLFIHQGQQNVKEIHFHPQIPGTIISTAEDGFNVFKPAITSS